MNSKLFHISPHEAENPIDISLKEAFELLEHELRPPFPLNIPSPLEYSQLNRAILYGILTETHFGKVHFTHLNAIVIDGYSSFVNLLLKIVYESYSKLLKSVKVNLIWVTSKLVDVSAVGVEGLLIGLMRQIVGGDFSDGNLWLSNELLKIFVEKFEFLLEEPFLLTSSLYTYLRLLADHYKLKGVQTLEDLKRLEIDFCVKVLRNHFSLCLVMGRDLVRLLQDLILIPEFRAIWKDLLLNPAEFKTPEFLDISHLYYRRTSSRYFLLRITPEMEIQLKFLLTHVRWGHQKRYQAWFAKKFFCHPESETIICDIVRFICCAHHPPNEIIRSDIISRWAVIGWLLKCCRKNHAEANTKLALFYDWLFFDEKIDNIMNIEPGILLMVKSIPEYIDITHTLLEFLVLLVDNYDVQRKNVIIRGVSTAFHVLEKNRVVDSLGDLISCNLLSSVLKERLSYILSVSKSKAFDERSTAGLPHCSLQSLSLPSAHVESRPPLSTYVRKLKRPRENAHVETRASLSTEVRTLKRPRENVLVTNAENVSSPVLQKTVSSCSLPVITDKSPITIIEELVQSLGETIKQSNKKGLQTLEKILFLFASLGSKSLDPAVAGDSVLRPEVLARQITEVFKSKGYEMFVPLKSPEEFSCDDEIQSATTLVICSFIFSQTKQMLEMILFWSRSGYPVGPHLLSYASRLSSEVSSIGNLMDGDSYAEMSNSDIPFLKHHVDRYLSFKRAQEKDPIGIQASASKMDAKLAVKLVEGAFASYKNFLILREFSQKSEDTSLAKLLFSDLLSCCRWEKKSLKALFSSIFCYLSELSMSKDEFIKLVVGQFDHADLVTLQFELCLKRFCMFGKDTRIISHLVKCSLNWGFVEQQRFWGLMASELAVSKIQVEKIVVDCSVIIDPSVHSIATEGLFILCSRCAPTPALVGTVMSLPDNTFGEFAAAVLANWVVSNGSMLFSSMAECLEKPSKDKDPVFLDAAGVKVDNSTRLGSTNFLEKKGMKSIDCLSELPTPEITNALEDAAVVQNRSFSSMILNLMIKHWSFPIDSLNWLVLPFNQVCQHLVPQGTSDELHIATVDCSQQEPHESSFKLSRKCLMCKLLFHSLFLISCKDDYMYDGRKKQLHLEVVLYKEPRMTFIKQHVTYQATQA